MRELNHNTAAVIACVERGERLAITRNGERVAVIEPITPHPLAALISHGFIRPASADIRDILNEEENASGSEGLRAMLADRENDTRW